MEFSPGVFDLPITIETEQGERTFHPSAVELADGGVLLVDVCFAHTLDQHEERLGEHGFSHEDVRGVLVTHQDGDHVGGLAALRERVDHPFTVYAHEDDAPAVDGREDPFKSGDDRYPATRVDVELVGGETFHSAAGPVRVVATPGHTPGHLSLYVPESDVLVAGDATVADEDGLAGPNEQFTPEMAEAVGSLWTLVELDPEKTLAYHGGIVDHGHGGLEDLHDRLSEE